MATYKLTPFAAFVESHLITGAPQHAIFHRLTGEMVEPDASVFALLQAARAGRSISLTPDQLLELGESGRQIQGLIDVELLVPQVGDALASFLDYWLNRPRQNPALTYKNERGEVVVVSISMAERAFSPEAGKLPPVIEESFDELTTNILLAADGTRTLRQIYQALQPASDFQEYDRDFRNAIEFLSKPERQLIKLAPSVEAFASPFYPANLVPRNLYHSIGTNRPARGADTKSLTDFHKHGIDSATWEFDVIEPTVNHAFRFPSEVLGGLSYGARFCASLLDGQIVELVQNRALSILEIGGGTGVFARAFLEQLQMEKRNAQYHILDLAPVLIENQMQVLAEVEPPVIHFQQDATNFHVGASFDLIVANEVIADFPVAEVRKRAPENSDRPVGPISDPEWSGDGVGYVTKYGLSTANASDLFFVNSGVFEFLERAWQHLAPGGAVVLTEYGGTDKYPMEAHHLNHSEFSIHFGHVMQCAQKLGFACRLQTLSDFLNADENVRVLNGSNEHIQCLNHVFQKHGEGLEYRVISEREFRTRFQEIVDRIDLSGFSFQPSLKNFHYGPNLSDFMALILKKPLR